MRAASLSQGPAHPADLPIETLVDAEGRFARDHELPAAGMLLVRPDGWIAATAKAAGELDGYVERWPRVDEPASRAPVTGA